MAAMMAVNNKIGQQIGQLKKDFAKF